MKNSFTVLFAASFAVLISQSSPVHGASFSAFQMYGAQSNNVLWPASGAVDQNMGTDYSSNYFPNSNPQNTVLFAWLVKPQLVNQVILGARTSPKGILGFPLSYDIWLTAYSGHVGGVFRSHAGGMTRSDVGADF
jgi:hypothetical protein